MHESERDVVLGLGSNLGDSPTILQGAVDDLAAVDGLRISACSPVYETDPVGGPEQPVFLNAVIVGRTTLRNHELLTVAQAVERHWQRARQMRWGPRTLDVDIVAVGQDTWDDPDLTIPHRLAHQRAFVLVPWLDVQPEAVIPGRGSVREMLCGLDVSGVRPTGYRLVVPAPSED